MTTRTDLAKLADSIDPRKMWGMQGAKYDDATTVSIPMRVLFAASDALRAAATVREQASVAEKALTEIAKAIGRNANWSEYDEISPVLVRLGLLTATEHDGGWVEYTISSALKEP